MFTHNKTNRIITDVKKITIHYPIPVDMYFSEI